MTFSVVQGILDPGAGSMIQIDTNHWFNWLVENKSFRYESNKHTPFTARKEKSDYWYGYRKVAGKLHKRYIGKSLELHSAKLEEIAKALNAPPEPRTPKITQTVTEKVAEEVTQAVTDDRLTALELQVRTLQESLEALRSELPGKSESGNSSELPMVADDRLQIELGNLQAENEALKQQLESERLQGEWLKRDLGICAEKQREGKSENELLRQELAETKRHYVELLETSASRIRNLEADLASPSELTPTPIAIDLSGKAAEILSFMKPYLIPKAPKNLLSKLEDILGDD